MNSHYNATLYPLQDKVLAAIDSLATHFYLTGGTVLSRGYYQHRYSDDLDLFVNRDKTFTNQAAKVLQKLESIFQIQVNIKSSDFVSLNINKILKLDLVNDSGHHIGQTCVKKF